MGRLAFTVAVTGSGDIEAARADLWTEVRRFVGAYLGGREYVEPWEYLDDADPLSVVDHSGGELCWSFPDLGGHCPTSSGAWVHWMGLAFAVEWDRFAVRLADRHALTLAGPRPDLGDLLTRAPRHYVTLDGYLWHITGDRLYGDGRDLPVEALSAGVRIEVVDRGRERCRCALCVHLRPDDTALADWLLDETEGEDLPAARLAAWKLVNMHQTWPNVLLALIEAAGPAENSEAMADLIDRYAPRLTDARLTVEANLSGFDTPGARAMAARFLSGYSAS